MAQSINIRSLSYRYFEEAPPALRDVTLSIPSGSCTAILGSAGAGKTTLLHILSGILGSQFTTGKAEGAVEIGDNEFLPIPSRALFPQVGYLMQDAPLQLSGIKGTVLEEVAFTLDNLNVPGNERKRRVAAILSALAISHLAHRKPTRLSGGELQRVALASVLVAEPSLLLLDEPVNALDSLAQHAMTSLVRSLKGKTTVVIADSGINFALSAADLFVVLDAGQMVFSGTRRQFLDSLEAFSLNLSVEPWKDILAQSKIRTINQRVNKVFN
jgi:energy-coupling factor transporter ATP-binding protein EcfA2